ncbi:FkbM family methyltransferase [Roseovarius aestuarii]|uniref:Methyltransferase FkbM domain-containing protein n=1 Tax=Roseovarius aestuarii TaxID=475083 RepID=A0A1X7BW65_9RHOB|nr:FkbM family methyltransferase [Roseovarius aestuarii]SMC13844.1 hypothetical protein ROA7745_03704 [Roseovarius aestuarii]
MNKPKYKTVLETHGIKVPFVSDVISPRMEQVIGKGRYEASEIKLLRKILRPRDRVLELGAGVGVVSTAAALVTGPEKVIVVEANPNLIPIIHETHKLNGVEGVEILNGVGVGAPVGGEATFYLREDFWASSLEKPHERETGTITPVSVSQIDLNAIFEKHRPSVFVLDIEGGELDLLPTLDLSSCRSVVIELHPKVYQLEGIARCFDALRTKGFAYDAKQSRGGTVVVFSRIKVPAKTQPRVTAVTCMKDEGPFILEWIAYHKMVGVTDFLIFTNDCSDGTTEILDQLDHLGHVRHLPNPSMGFNSPRHQPAALQYARYHREYRDADWIISMDVDEFINVHIGDRTLNALFDANSSANIISLCHLDFGCDGIEHYEDRLVTEQMRSCDDKFPAQKPRRGIKTLIHRSAPGYTLSNHRPIFDDPNDKQIDWIDGGGKKFPKTRRVGQHKGMTPHGVYEQVQLNHYPVRSIETYLTKAVKGNVIAIDSFVGLEYWVKRNGNADRDETIQPLLDRTKQKMTELLADPVLFELHQKAVCYHKAEIEKLRKDKTMLGLLKSAKASHEKTKGGVKDEQSA